MRLRPLLEGVRRTEILAGTTNLEEMPDDVSIERVRYDSRTIQSGDCFVALRGSGQNGNQFIGDALRRGARLIVADDRHLLVQELSRHGDAVGVVVENSRQALARISANFYHNPSERLMLLGVTGTNGKTTTTHVLRSILESGGKKTGLIGTIEYAFGEEQIPATHTTPESLELNDLLSRMVGAGCEAVTMEVSSHALDQDRVDGLKFAAAVFTNLTQDHLDYHDTMDAYFAAKQKLFLGLDASAHAVVNTDDPWGKRLAESTHGRVVSYGSDSSATVSVSDVQLSLSGTTFAIRSDGDRRTVRSPLLGRFNVWNSVASIATGIALGLPWNAISSGVEAVSQVRGRFERIVSPKYGWTAIIDYAHTPDALENCLTAIQDVLRGEGSGKIITVFGAGGDRDIKKRPLMGKVASVHSDIVIVTSDNPRTEDPEKIISDIVTGIPPDTKCHRISDRRNAIEKGLALASKGDVVLIAGKGHEDYQVLGKKKIHFSDHEIVKEIA